MIGPPVAFKVEKNNDVTDSCRLLPRKNEQNKLFFVAFFLLLLMYFCCCVALILK